MPAVALTDHGSLAGAVELVPGGRQAGRQAADRLRGLRRRRPPRAEEGLRAPDAARRDERGLREPDQALLARLPRGLLLQAARRLGAARAARERAGRALRLPLRAASARRSRRTAPADARGRARPARPDLRARLDLRRDPERGPRRPGSGSTRSSPKLAEEAGLPLVATGDVHYLRHEDARAHEALLCIQSGDSLKNPNHWKLRHRPVLLQDAGGDGARLPGPTRRRCARTLEIAERCNVDDRARRRSCCPSFPVPGRPRRVRVPRRALREGPAEALRPGDARAPGAARVRAEDDPRDGLRRLLPDRLGLHPLREAERRSRSARAAARRPARSPPTASRSPTSTRSATACSSSASSTRAASRCRTWTSTSPSPAATG